MGFFERTDEVHPYEGSPSVPDVQSTTLTRNSISLHHSTYTASEGSIDRSYPGVRGRNGHPGHFQFTVTGTGTGSS